jgi:hypothetical protein
LEGEFVEEDVGAIPARGGGVCGEGEDARAVGEADAAGFGGGDPGAAGGEGHGVGEDVGDAVDFFHEFEGLAFAGREDDPVLFVFDGVGDDFEGGGE